MLIQGAGREKALGTAGLVSTWLTCGLWAQSANGAEIEVLAAMRRLQDAQAQCQTSEQAQLRVADHTISGRERTPVVHPD